MIEELIKELIRDCVVCHEGYIYNSKDEEIDSTEPKECPACNGTGKQISYEGEILRHIILHGEKP